jgi:hypothetical protein
MKRTILIAALVMIAPAASAKSKGSKPRARKPAPAAPVVEAAPEPAPAPAPPEETVAAAAAPEPAPAPPPRTEAPAPAPAEKPRGSSVEALRAQYEALKDELFRSRARRETLEGALLSTQLLPVIRWEGGRHHSVTRAEVRLDGVRLWDSGDGLVSDKPVDLAVKSAPPGAHVLGVRVEVKSRDDARLGYVSDQSFALVLPEGKKTRVEITVDESGSAPSYDPEIEVEVKSK